MSGDTVFLADEELPAPRLPRAVPVWRQRLREATPLQLALLFSVVAHLLVLSVQLATPGSAPRQWVESKLDVILVNARDEQAPTDAQALAQANLRGGGDGAANERAQSPMLPTENLSVGDSATDTHRRLKALQAEQQELLTSLRRDLARLPPPNAEAEAASAEGRALAERRRLLLTQMAELERRVNENNAPPRQRYISPATQEVAYAVYYDKLRKRIELRGTHDFPTRAGVKLYGQLTMNISVGAQGQVLDIEVIEPSGTAGLDSRAMAIVRAAAPFGTFTKTMRAEAEVLVLSARFTFDRNKGVQAQLQGNAP
jgi:periplasmic protein TonB